ncbi:HYR domain-containing protein [Hyalangium rubrum]|uniref:HYR domain-containing protein n=1 Tax=Hyalangium rubrum TaxID=3103134 RepID=A0ABU5HD73_9BACT|nr:FG-GAP-like repeat-containing protein [Hyalangium sp. s54d21]MDY7231413.1 HYR domain-containing protein [Hyalangium sp. s54d21]
MSHGRGIRGIAAVVVLATGGGCSLIDSEDGSGARGAGNLSDTCQVVPPFTPNFQPELQWEWTGSTLAPEFKQVMMTPIVVEVNGDGIPDVVFSTFAGNDWREGVLRAISGDDGHDLWASMDPAHRIKAAASIAAGDIDNDGLVEICGIPHNGRGIICYENDGTFKFRSAEDAFDYNEWGGPSLADLDGDGTVEILDGNRVYSNTGALKWVGSDGMGGAQYTGPVSFAADIDQDGTQELVNGRSIYNPDGSLHCANTDIPHGFAGVGNFDGDIQGEVVVSGHGKVSLMDDNCALKWSIDIPGGCANGCGGAPTIADFDNDGTVEVAVVGDNAISMLETNGTVKWTSTIQDWSSGKSGSSAFDFEDDGQMELLYADEVSLRIYNGATGQVRFETRHSTGTTHESPIIADVDGDFAADIVVATNNTAYPPYNGIRVYHDRLEGWARTRRIWNQSAYSITNVNNDGTIPAHPVSHWLKPRLNTFHSNVANYFGDGESPYAAPDITVSELSAACSESSLNISAQIVNQGDTPVAAGLKVSFYRGNPASGGTLLGVTTLTSAIPVDGFAPVLLSVGAQPVGGANQIFVVADDDGSGSGRDTECDETNNGASAEVDVTCGAPPTSVPPVAICQNVTVNANAQCQGSGDVNNGSHDPDGQPGPFTVTQAPAGPFGLGSHPVTLTANDGAASAQCVGTVTVVDVTPPALSCPASQTVDTCDADGVAATFQASATDNCGPAPVTCSAASGATFPLGQTAVSCSAADGSGNMASCSFNVTVRPETTAPSISCPAPIVINACVEGGPVAHFNVGSSDNCGAPSVTCSHASGSTFPVGQTVVTCTATDTLGNTAACSFDVTVNSEGEGAPVPGASLGNEIWPPNHKYVDLTLADCAAPAQDTCGGSLPADQYGTILRVSSDEVEDANGNGDGRTCDDITIAANGKAFKVRAEREGTGDGRVYTVHYAINGPGGTAQSNCRVFVPHDQSGNHAVIDSGVKFCVGQGCPAGTGGSALCN